MVLAPPRGQRLDMSRLFDQMQRDQEEARALDMQDQHAGGQLMANAGRMLGEQIAQEAKEKRALAGEQEQQRGETERSKGRDKAAMERVTKQEEGATERANIGAKGRVEAVKARPPARSAPRPAPRGDDNKDMRVVFQESWKNYRAVDSSVGDMESEAKKRIGAMREKNAWATPKQLDDREKAIIEKTSTDASAKIKERDRFKVMADEAARRLDPTYVEAVKQELAKMDTGGGGGDQAQPPPQDGPMAEQRRRLRSGAGAP